MPKFTGVVPPVVTPLTETFEVDYPSFTRVIENLIDGGVHGLFVLGSTSEVVFHAAAERTKIIEHAVKVNNGRLPIFVGVIDPTTDRVIEHARIAKAAGADALVVTAPFYARTNQAETIDHFRYIRDAFDVPLVAYDIPVCVHLKLERNTTVTLGREGTIAGVKDSSADDGNLRYVMLDMADRPDFFAMTGSEIVVDNVLGMGAHGVVPGLANVDPHGYVKLWNLFADQRRVGRGRRLQDRHAAARHHLDQRHGAAAAHAQFRRDDEDRCDPQVDRPALTAMPEPILDISGLTTVYRISGKDVAVVQDLDLAIAAGETVALVGESGSGKSVTSLSVLRLLPRIGRVAKGSVGFRGKSGVVRDLAQLDADALRQVRGNDVGMIFQEPMTSLNPVYTVGEQIAEPIRIHLGKSHKDAAAAAVQLLADVGIPDPARRAKQYPHELSGGMRQRATIAMALACDPALLIADEPTTALDVTIQAQMLDLLQQLQAQRGMGILFVTHNLGVVAEIADRVAVMYAGRVVETGRVADVFAHPRHPYTIGLMRSVPRLGEATRLKQAGTPLPTIPGTVPSLARLPQGCSFAPRCSYAIEACRAAVPSLLDTGNDQASRCIRWQEL